MLRAAKLASSIVRLYRENRQALAPLKVAADRSAVLFNIQKRLVSASRYAPIQVSLGQELNAMLHPTKRTKLRAPRREDRVRAELCLKVWRLVSSVDVAEFTPDEFAKAFIIGKVYRCPFTRAEIPIEGALTYSYLSAQLRFAPFFLGSELEQPVDDAIQLTFAEGESAVFALDAISPIFIDGLRPSPFGNLLAALVRSEPLTEPLRSAAAAMKPRTFVAKFPSLIIYLRDTVRFDDLKDLVEFYIQWFNSLSSGELHRRQCARFLEGLVVAFRNLNGRSIHSFPSTSPAPMENENIAHLYFRLALGTMRYELANELIANLQSASPSAHLKMAFLTVKSPFRPERDAVARLDVRDKLIEKIKDALPADYPILPDLASAVLRSDAAQIEKLATSVSGVRDASDLSTNHSDFTSKLITQLIRLKLV